MSNHPLPRLRADRTNPEGNDRQDPSGEQVTQSFVHNRPDRKRSSTKNLRDSFAHETIFNEVLNTTGLFPKSLRSTSPQWVGSASPRVLTPLLKGRSP